MKGGDYMLEALPGLILVLLAIGGCLAVLFKGSSNTE
jgi:hypothetical protein